MERVGDFPEKLALAMRAGSFSRVALAQAVQVDKSLIGRWLSGAVHPTEHNLARLAAVIAEVVAAFRLADWFLGADAFAARLGMARAPAEPLPASLRLDLLGPFLDHAHDEAARRGAAYEGFWRTTRPSLLMTDRLFHDYGMIRLATNGLLEVRMKGAGLGFSGWMLPGEGNLFVFLQDPVGMTPLSLVLSGVTLPRAMVLDGLLLLAGLDAVRTLGALPILLERVGDLTGDPARDDARCAGLHDEAPDPLEPLDPVVIEQRIFRSTGPLAAAVGGSPFLTVGAQDSLSRGATSGGLVG